MPPDPEPPPAPRPASYDVAIAMMLAWGLGVMRVVSAIVRNEAPSREVDLAWLIVLLLPIVVWKDIAGQRHDETEPRCG